MSTWGDFQSVIQLSIAANGTVAAFPDFFKGSTETNVALVEDLINQANSINTSSSDHMNEQKKIGDRLHNLRTSYRKLKLKQDAFIYKFLSWASMLFILLGITALLVSSFNYRHPIHVSGKVFVLIQLAPLVLGLATVAGFSIFSLIVLRNKITSISKEINDLEIAVGNAAKPVTGAIIRQEQVNAV